MFSLLQCLRPKRAWATVTSFKCSHNTCRSAHRCLHNALSSYAPKSFHDHFACFSSEHHCMTSTRVKRGEGCSLVASETGSLPCAYSQPPLLASPTFSLQPAVSQNVKLSREIAGENHAHKRAHTHRETTAQAWKDACT